MMGKTQFLDCLKRVEDAFSDTDWGDEFCEHVEGLVKEAFLYFPEEDGVE